MLRNMNSDWLKKKRETDQQRPSTCAHVIISYIVRKKFKQCFSSLKYWMKDMLKNL